MFTVYGNNPRSFQLPPSPLMYSTVSSKNSSSSTAPKTPANIVDQETSKSLNQDSCNQRTKKFLSDSSKHSSSSTAPQTPTSTLDQETFRSLNQDFFNLRTKKFLSESSIMITTFVVEGEDDSIRCRMNTFQEKLSSGQGKPEERIKMKKSLERFQRLGQKLARQPASPRRISFREISELSKEGYSDYLKQKLTVFSSKLSSTSSSQQGSPRRVSFRGISELSREGSCSSKPIRTSGTIMSLHDRLQERNSSQSSNSTEAGDSPIRWIKKKSMSVDLRHLLERNNSQSSNCTEAGDFSSRWIKKKSMPVKLRRDDMKKSLPRIEDNVIPFGCLSPVPGFSSPRGFRYEFPVIELNIDDQGEFRFPLLSINEESDEE